MREHRAELAGRVKLQISGGERGVIDYPWQDKIGKASCRERV